MSDFNYRKKKWLVLKDKKVFETPIFDLLEKKVAPGEGETAGDFYVIQAPDWINIIALTPGKKIVLVEQYRHGIEEVTLEIPGGMVDPGEKPLESAKRELGEETGYTAGSWSYLGKTSSNPAIINNFTHLYLASGCRETAFQKTGNFEDIQTHVIDLEEFFDHVSQGTVHHAIVLSAVAKYLLYDKNNL